MPPARHQKDAASLEAILADVLKTHQVEEPGTPSASSTPAAAGTPQVAFRSPFHGNSGHNHQDLGLAQPHNYTNYGAGSTFEQQRANDISRSHMFARPGDWPCPQCGENQYARNPFCRRCKTPRPTSAGPAPRFEPGDWICPICGDFQYKRNRDCRKCGTPKSACDNQIEAAAAAMRISTKDWTCFGCGAPQHATNAQCKNCNTRRPAMYTMVLEHQQAVTNLTGEEPLAQQMAREMGVPNPEKALQKPAAAKAAGDWDCPKCGNTNFAQSFSCRCGGQKPETGGGASSSEKPIIFVAATKRAVEPAEEKPEIVATPKDDADSFLYKLPGMKKRRKTVKPKVLDAQEEKKETRQEESKEEALRKEKERAEAEALVAKIMADSEKAAKEEPKKKPPAPESIESKVVEPKVASEPEIKGAFTSVAERDALDDGHGDASVAEDRKAVLRDFWSFYVPSLQTETKPNRPDQKRYNDARASEPARAAPAPEASKKEPISFLAQWQAEADGKSAPKVAPPSPPTPEWREEPSEDEEEPEPPAPAAGVAPKRATRPGMTFV